MTHDEATKNQPGGIEDINSVGKEARMYSISEDPLFDGLNCLKNYIQKLNPNSESELWNVKMTFCTKTTAGGQQTWRNDERSFQTGVSFKNLHKSSTQITQEVGRNTRLHFVFLPTLLPYSSCFLRALQQNRAQSGLLYLLNHIIIMLLGMNLDWNLCSTNNSQAFLWETLGFGSNLVQSLKLCLFSG